MSLLVRSICFANHYWFYLVRWPVEYILSKLLGAWARTRIILTAAVWQYRHPPRDILLPVEVWDEVIGHLRQDRRSLSVCRLVCKTWLLSSQSHLFEILTLHVPLGHRNKDTLETHINHLGAYAQTLHIKNGIMPAEAGDINEILSRCLVLKEITSLRLSHLAIPHLCSSFSPLMLSAFCITNLTLHHVMFQDFKELASFICGFVHLEHLDMCPHIFSQETEFYSHAYGFPENLYSIGYSIGLGIDPVCDWISSLDNKIRFLDIRAHGGFSNDYLCPTVGRILHNLGTHLEKFAVTFPGGLSSGELGKHLDFSGNTGIRSFLFHLHGHGDHTFGEEILSLLDCPILEELILVWCWSTDITRQNWQCIDDQLNGPNFRNLRTVTVQWPTLPLCELEAVRERERLIRSLLPKCHSRNILRLNLREADDIAHSHPGPCGGSSHPPPWI